MDYYERKRRKHLKDLDILARLWVIFFWVVVFAALAGCDRYLINRGTGEQPLWIETIWQCSVGEIDDDEYYEEDVFVCLDDTGPPSDLASGWRCMVITTDVTGVRPPDCGN